MKKLLFLLLLIPVFTIAQQKVCCRPIIVENNNLPDTAGLVTDFNFGNQSSVVASSSRVLNITDAKNNVVSSQSDTTKQPTYHTTGGPNNNAYASFDGNRTLKGALLTSSNNFTIIVIRRISHTAAPFDNRGVFQNGAGSTGYGIVDWQGSGNGFYTGGYLNGVTSNQSNYLLSDTSRWEIVCYSHSTGNNKLYNTLGALFAPIAPTANPVTPVTSHVIGNDEGGPAKFKGDIFRILLYNRQLSDIEINTMCAYFYTRFALPLPILFSSDGDSITATANNSTSVNYPTYALIDLLPSHYFYLNQAAVTGYRSIEVLDSLQSTVLSRYKTGVTNIFSLLIGHNDYGTGVSTDTLIRHVDTILARTHRKGYKNIIVTLLNTTAYSQTLTDAFNNYARANYKAMGADTLYDANVRTNLADPTNLTYFLPGGTHLTLAGAQDAAIGLEPYLTYYLTH